MSTLEHGFPALDGGTVARAPRWASTRPTWEFLVPTQAIVPYCGLPVDPQALLRHWNVDPVLLTCLALLVFSYCVAPHWFAPQAKTFCAAGAVLATVALISPLCPFSVSLFSARIGRLPILTSLATPLLALSLPPARG